MNEALGTAGADPGRPGETERSTHVLYVCTGCNVSKTLEEKNGRRGGAALWEALQAEMARRGGPPPAHLEQVACLSVCKDSCAVALTAAGK